jgi:hypothetical protein
MGAESVCGIGTLFGPPVARTPRSDRRSWKEWIGRNRDKNNIWVIRSGNVVEDNLATAPVDTLGNGYAFGNKANYFANNKASGNQTNFAGEVPEGPSDGGGNLVLEHYVPPPPPPPPPTPSTDTPSGGAPSGGGTGDTGK